MANLETLYIEVSGSANNAKSSIDGLVGSLNALGQAVSSQLQNLQRLSVVLSDVARKVSSSRIGRGSARDAGTGEKAPIPKTKLDALLQKYHSLTGEIEKAAEKGNALSVANKTLTQFSTQDKINKEMNALRGLSDAQKKTEDTTKKLGNAMKSSSKHSHSFASSIGRIAKTMLIRAVLRSLMKAFSEAWTSVYNFSKSVGGEFASNVEKLRGAISGTAIKLVSAFAPALNAIIPVINTVAGAIQWLCSLLQQLFAMLGMGSDLFGASAESIDAYSKSAGGGGGATKGLLASFDELNVIQSAGGGGGGGGNAKTFITDTVSEEMAKINLIIGESMIGLGLILACFGHIPLGVGLIALGAASVVKTVAGDFGQMSQEVKDQVGKIMTIAGESLIALGLILSVFGHPVIGVAAIAMGVANLVGVSAISGGLSDSVKAEITKITAIAGGALLALGIILVCAGVLPLGIGLIVAGGVSLATAVALNWGSIVETVNSVMAKIANWFVTKWGEISSAVSTAWEAVSQWVSDNIFSNISKAWNIAIAWLNGLWGTVSNAVSDAWEAVSQWFSNAFSAISLAWTAATAWLSSLWQTVENAIATAWEAVSQWFVNAYSAVAGAWNIAIAWLNGLWGTVQKAVVDAWTAVCEWFGNIFSKLSSAWTLAIAWLSGLWGNIKTAVVDAWESVLLWFGDIFSKISKAWNIAIAWLNGLWSSVCESVGSAWTAVLEWFGNIFGKLSLAWTGAIAWLNGLWETVKGYVKTAWDSVLLWFGDIYTQFSEAWNSAIGWINEAWGSVQKAVSDAWGEVEQWFTNIFSKLSGAWTLAIGWLSGLWGTVETAVSSAWTAVSEWFGNIFSKISIAWTAAIAWLNGLWDTVKSAVGSAWKSVEQWFSGIYAKLTGAWNDAIKWISDKWDSVKTAIGNAWSAAEQWWTENVASNFTNAWESVTTTFSNLYTTVSNIVNEILNLDGQSVHINLLIYKREVKATEADGQIKKVSDFSPNGQLVGTSGRTAGAVAGITGAMGVSLTNDVISVIKDISNANGAYGIPSGDLFIANEAGAELVGSINGHTSVANQGQIIEGISRGVQNANESQNALLRQQNDLLRGILEKDSSVRLSASAALGRVAQQSLDMYSRVGG